MFERFTEEARAAVVRAQEEARSLGHAWIGTEHLLLGVLAGDDALVTGRLGALGLTRDAVRDQLRPGGGRVGLDDGSALRDLGIDLDSVRRRAEELFGPGALDRAGRPSRRRPFRRRGRGGSPRGHIPFQDTAKKSLELALREAVAAGAREIRATHLVLGLMRTDGLATRLVTALGVAPDDVRRAMLDLGRAA